MQGESDTGRTRSGIRLGLRLPNGGASVVVPDLVRLTLGAERLGLDSVWVVDRWLRPWDAVEMPGVPEPVELPVEFYRSVFDPIEVLSYLAGQTTRILLGLSAVNVLYQPPVLLARRLATLDRLSDGRVVAGVTSGWMAEEFEVAGVPATRKGAGFDDHLAAMRAVWGPDPVVYDGSVYRIPRSDVGPKPLNPEGIPLFVGYNTAAGLRRAARIGDDLHPYRNEVHQLRADLTLWREAVAAAGKDADRMPVVLRTSARTGGGDPDQVGETLFAGPVDRWPDDLATLERLGVDHVLLQFEPGAGIDETLDVLGRLQEARRG